MESDCGQAGDRMKRRHGCLHAVFLLLLAAVIAAGFWYYENNVIQTEQFVLYSERLPEAFDGFRVVELADLHGKAFGEDQGALLAAVAEAEPDLIAICGDLVDDGSDLQAMADLAGRLVEIAPTAYVSGNHEWALEDPRGFFAMLEEAGVTVLRNTFCRLSLGEAGIILAGVDDPNGPYDQKTPEEVVEEIRAGGGDPYILMLAHRNDQLERWSSLAVDVVLTGHGHGGVIRLPGVGGLLGTDRELFPEYTAGLYEQGRTRMIVSRGLGSSGIGVRLFNRPHLPVIVLRSGAGPE